MTTARRPPRYVAIGSSYAAGPGIGPAAPGRPEKARQSARNYAHQVAHRLDLDLIDVTSSGATVADILSRPQLGQPPQMDAVTEQTDLVTVTVGGNDIGYIPSLIAACLPPWMARMPVLGRRLRQATAPAHQDDRLDRTADAVGELLSALQHRAPAARIICVDYLTVLPAGHHPELPFDDHTHRRLIDLAGDLDAALARACTDHDVELLQASGLSLGHHAWSTQAWTTGWIRPRPGRVMAAFHPNIQGMTAVADRLTELLTPAD